MEEDTDSFHEANLLLSTALKQLDEAMNRNENAGRLYKMYAESQLEKPSPRQEVERSNGHSKAEPSAFHEGLVPKPTAMAWDASVANWDDNITKDTSSIDSTPESSAGDSPPSDIRSSSASSIQRTLERFIKVVTGRTQ
jgi:hypothetical protein